MVRHTTSISAWHKQISADWHHRSPQVGIIAWHKQISADRHHRSPQAAISAWHKQISAEQHHELRRTHHENSRESIISRLFSCTVGVTGPAFHPGFPAAHGQFPLSAASFLT